MSQPRLSDAEPAPFHGSISAGELAAVLRGRGERLTRPRMALLRALVALADDHPTADRLLAAARVTDPDLAESSLYRGLEWLESAGIAQHSHFGHGPAVWHRVGDERLHLLCERCGVVQHVPPSALRASFRRLVQTHGFTPLPHHFAISGICAACGTDELL